MPITQSEVTIYAQLTDLWRGAYIRICAVADFSGYTERYTRRLLVQLEQRGAVARRGQRGGWRPTLETRQWAEAR